MGSNQASIRWRIGSQSALCRGNHYVGDGLALPSAHLLLAHAGNAVALHFNVLRTLSLRNRRGDRSWSSVIGTAAGAGFDESVESIGRALHTSERRRIRPRRGWHCSKFFFENAVAFGNFASHFFTSASHGVIVFEDP